MNTALDVNLNINILYYKKIIRVIFVLKEMLYKTGIRTAFEILVRRVFMDLSVEGK